MRGPADVTNVGFIFHKQAEVDLPVKRTQMFVFTRSFTYPSREQENISHQTGSSENHRLKSDLVGNMLLPLRLLVMYEGFLVKKLEYFPENQLFFLNFRESEIQSP